MLSTTALILRDCLKTFCGRELPTTFRLGTARFITKTAKRYDSASSQRWLIRQRSDPYVRRARIDSYRCRSAFKLLQLNERVPGGLLHPGDIVVDCGAAPGSWTQVATSLCTGLKQSNSGLVISFDLLDFAPVPGARCYPHTDVQDWKNCARLVDQAINEHRARAHPSDLVEKPNGQSSGVTLVLSDMAPNASGIRQLDIPAMMNMASAVLQLALRVSVSGATLVIKLWQCPEAEVFRKTVSQFYRGPWDNLSHPSTCKKSRGSTSRIPISASVPAVRFLKPDASRSDSAEIYLVAKGFVPDAANRFG